MTKNNLARIREYFHRTESFLQSSFYRTYPLNEFWKKHNVPQMLNILHNAENEKQALELIQSTYFFVVNLTGLIAQKSLIWQWNRLERDDPQLLADIEIIGESKLVPHFLTISHKNSRYSIDIFRIATITKNILLGCNIETSTKPVFFELGAGLGHLARFILHKVPKAKYIISDLPISLCFSYLFLSYSFPEKRIGLLEADMALTPEILEQYDIILTPPSILKNTKKINVEVFINTCSLGEMDNSVSSQWFEYIENTLNPAYVYSFNRFLNHIDNSVDFQWRTQENAHLEGIGSSWKVLKFMLEDERMFGPYLACIHPRYLELILKRDKDATSSKVDLHELAERAITHASISLYDNHSWSVNYYGAKISNDLTINGDFFAYWNAARLRPCPLSYLILLIKLDRLNYHCRMPFEETKFLERKLADFANSLIKPAKSALESYLKRRLDTTTNNEFINVFERNAPHEIITTIEILKKAIHTQVGYSLRRLLVNG